MGHKYIESLVRKIINEAPVDYGDYPERMDPRVQQKIEDPESIYAKNRGFQGGVSDVERLSGDRFVASPGAVAVGAIAVAAFFCP